MIKQLLYIVAIVTGCTGCRSLKESSVSKHTDSLSVTYQIDSTKHIFHQEIDTTLSRHIVTTITEVVFDDCIDNNLNQTQSKVVSTDNFTSTILNMADGKIKKITTTIIEEHAEKKGKRINHEASSDLFIHSAQKALRENSHHKVDIAPDPYRWRYIFIGLAVIAAAVTVIKLCPKSMLSIKTWNWVKKCALLVKNRFS